MTITKLAKAINRRREEYKRRQPEHWEAGRQSSISTLIESDPAFRASAQTSG